MHGGHVANVDVGCGADGVGNGSGGAGEERPDWLEGFVDEVRIRGGLDGGPDHDAGVHGGDGERRLRGGGAVSELALSDLGFGRRRRLRTGTDDAHLVFIPERPDGLLGCCFGCLV